MYRNSFNGIYSTGIYLVIVNEFLGSLYLCSSAFFVCLFNSKQNFISCFFRL